MLLLLRRQLNLSDTLSTAQLRLLYGTNGATAGDKRRVRVLQLVKEVEQKLDASSALTDGLSVEQLLQRAVQLAARIQQTNNAATLEKWKPKISAAIPRDPRQLEPETPWKEHVMQQEMTRHINQWSGAANGVCADGVGSRGSAMLHTPEETPLSKKLEVSATATGYQQQETDSGEKPTAEIEKNSMVAVDETVSIVKNIALSSSDGHSMSLEAKSTLKQQGRVSAWRSKDAAQDAVDAAHEASVINAHLCKEEESPAKTSRRTSRPVSSRLYPGPASPSPRGPSGSTGSRTPNSRMTKRRSSDKNKSSSVNGNASLGSLSMASINSARVGGSHSMSTRKRNQQVNGLQRCASKPTDICLKSAQRQKLTKLEQTLAELAAEADELLHS